MKVSFRYFHHILAILALLALSLSACGSADTGSNTNGKTDSKTPVTVHLAYFPNITHSIALVGVAKGTFQTAIGSNKLETKTFNAGPSLIEALLAGDIDIGYVGPNPAINGYVKSKGEALRIIAGASSGGALFIVSPQSNIKKASDLAGKKIATPQKGGTQDIALRHYLQQNNLKTNEQGGNVQIVPTENANILTQFKAGQLDGAWVPEPWASRLIQEGKGEVFLDERTTWPNSKFVTTNVIVRKEFLDQHPDIVKQFLQAHVETSQYINENLADAEKVINGELKKLTGKALKPEVLEQAFKNLDITYDPLAATLYTSADNAFNLGFLGKTKPDLQGILDLAPLNSVLESKKLAKVSA